MEKNTDSENYIKYYNYVIENLESLNTSGSNLVLSKISEMDSSNLQIGDIRKLCEYVEFIKLSENNKIYLYHQWWRYIK